MEQMISFIGLSLIKMYPAAQRKEGYDTVQPFIDR